MFYSGENNLITDVDGILVGNAEDKEIGTGTTILIPPKGSTAGADVRGGAPGTREVGALNPYNLVDTIDAIVLSGGSAWGLEAASSAANYIGKSGRGFKTSENIKNVPMVPAAILFDLNNGGNKDWGDEPPYNNLGIEASTRASEKFQLGNVGAGYGAKAGSLIGGLGSAILEWINENKLNKLIDLKRLGAKNDFIHNLGNQSYVRKILKLDSSSIIKLIKNQ